MVNKGICDDNQTLFKVTITQYNLYSVAFIRLPSAYEVNIEYNMLHNTVSKAIFPKSHLLDSSEPSQLTLH